MSTYATSTVKLYYVSSSQRWDLLANKLFIIEDIESFLATKTVKTLTLFQYIKHSLENSITVDLSQTYAEPLSASYKYVSITNSDTNKTYYYYVKNVYWRSKSAVRFDLVMDVLNTFKEGTDYSFKENTNILREHKDRYRKVNTNVFTFEIDNENLDDQIHIDELLVLRKLDNTFLVRGYILDMTPSTYTMNILNGDAEDIINNTNVKFYKEENDVETTIGTGTLINIVWETQKFRVIDYYPESISPILYCGNAEGLKLEDKEPLNVDWYLLYRNENDPSESLINPVECYLIPSEALKVSTGVLSSGAITSGTLENNKYYYLNLRNNGITLSNGVSFGRYIFYNDFAIIKKQENGLLSVSLCSGGVGGTYDLEDVVIYNDIEYITLNDLPQAYSETTTPYDVNTYISTILGNETESWTGTEVEQLIDSVSSIDKTDAKNIKLIKLPYSPYKFTITGGKIDLITSNWNYETLTQADNTTLHVLKLYNMRTKLINDMNSNVITPFSPLEVANFTPSINDLRKNNLDSKMYASEFYRGTFVYDSFSFVFQLEKCDLDYYITHQGTINKMSFRFVMTSTINSKFMMKFNTYVVKYASENYNNVMPIAVNNEEVLYNVPYINYVRTGYNYDVKNKNISTGLTWASVGAGAVGMAVSLALPSVPLKVAGVITSAVGMLITFFNAIATTQKNEMALDQKIKEQKNQLTSVAGSDDVDLRSEYTENRFKFLVYKPSPIMESLINDLFFYGGYATNIMGIPTHNNRLNFDFLQCNAEMENIGNIPNDCLEELINCFKNGATYIHKTTRTSNKWDVAQEYENWEKSLL